MTKPRGRFNFDRHADYLIECLLDGDPNDRFSALAVSRILITSERWLDAARRYGEGPVCEQAPDGTYTYTRAALIAYLRERSRVFVNFPKNFVPPPKAAVPVPVVKRPVGRPKKQSSLQAAE